MRSRFQNDVIDGQSENGIQTLVYLYMENPSRNPLPNLADQVIHAVSDVFLSSLITFLSHAIVTVSIIESTEKTPVILKRMAKITSVLIDQTV